MSRTLKEMVLDDKKFHYQMTDKTRQSVKYYLNQCVSLEKAEESFKELELLMSLFKEKDIPEWYTNEDLKKDRVTLEKLRKLSENS